MRKNLFEMGANLGEGWQSDNKEKKTEQTSMEIKEPNRHQLHIAKEKRRSKTVTIVKPFYVEKQALQHLLKELKKSLGTGGTHKENRLEFQGDIQEQLRKTLEHLGYRFKT